MRWLKYWHIVLVIALLSVAIYSGTVFAIACAICSALFLPALIILWVAQGKDASAQKKMCKCVGWLLLLPSIGLAACAVRLFFFDELSRGRVISYAAATLSAAMLVVLSLHLFSIRNDKSLAARFLRHAGYAAMSAPASLIICSAMLISEAEGAAIMIGISGVAFGLCALLAAFHLIVISLYDFQTTKESIRALSASIRSRRLMLIRVSLAKDVFLMVGKAAVGVVTRSAFMFVNALYSLGSGGARYLALKMHGQQKEEQLRAFRNIGVIILFSGLCYAAYSLRMFVARTSMQFSMPVALIIACYTFMEFTLDIRDIIRLKKSEDLASMALRFISLASTLISFVLTQTAIMSFSYAGDPSYSNGLSGLAFGSLAALVGVYMMIRSVSMKRRLSADL